MELSFPGTKVPPYGTFVHGDENSWGRKFLIPCYGRKPTGFCAHITNKENIYIRTKNNLNKGHAHLFTVCFAQVDEG